MYQTNLNYLRFNRYLKDFLNKGFIEALHDAEGNGCYHITARGKALLVVLRKANALGYE
jgi:predicted transcriptional regulator